MGFQQGIVLSEKSWTKWLIQFEATDIETSSFVDTRIHTQYMFSVINMDQSMDKLIFHIIGPTKYSKPTRPNQPVVYRAYVEGELLCLVKSIYAYLAQRSEIVTQDFTEFFISFGKPHHPASKDSLARWEILV